MLVDQPHEGVSGKTEVVAVLIGTVNEIKDQAAHLATVRHNLNHNAILACGWTVGDRGLELVMNDAHKRRYALAPVQVWQ